MPRNPTGLLFSQRFPVSQMFCFVLALANCGAAESGSSVEGNEPEDGDGGAGAVGGLGGGGDTASGGGTMAAGGSGGLTMGTAGAAGGMAGTAALGGMGGVDTPDGPRVPMFVAVGRGGRRIMSCDRGRTWIADKSVAPASQDNEHRTYTPKSLTYSRGTFIFLTGWGADSTTWVSKNGIDWLEQKQQDPYGGVGFDEGDFVLVGNRLLSKSSDQGASWAALNVPKPAYDRDAAAFTGVWAAGSDGKVVTRLKGGQWSTLAGCTGSRHGGIGASGGFAAGLGVMISVGDAGNTCGLTIATSAPLAAGKINAAVRGKPAFVGDAFWVATSDAIHSSVDGVNWTARSLPSDVRFELVARDASGTYAGASQSGGAFYFSDDGQRWTKAKAPTGNGLVNMVGGEGLPSAQCPLP